MSYPLLFPLRLLGAIFQWIAWPLTHVGELLRTGHWYHVSWTDRRGNHWEFVPNVSKRLRFAPPLIFSGRIQRAGSDDTDGI